MGTTANQDSGQDLGGARAAAAAKALMVRGRSPQSKKLLLLESLRGLAASYVMVGHIVTATLDISPGPLRIAFSFGQEAVMLFFLLSGFVICFTYASRPETTFAEYFLRRVARIYPVLLLGLLLTYAASSLAQGVRLNLDWHNLIGNLFMLQTNVYARSPRSWFAPYMNDFSLWSLSYEWWYYMLFFYIRFKLPERAWLGCAFALSLAATIVQVIYPNEITQILSYFILWWNGAELARGYLSNGWPSFKSQRYAIAGLTACLAVRLSIVDFGKFTPDTHGHTPNIEVWHLGAGLFIVLLALMIGKRGMAIFKKLLQPFSILAPFSYAIYVLHGPIIFNSDWLAPYLSSPFVRLLCYVSLVFIVSYLADGPYQRTVSRMILWRYQTPERQVPSLVRVP